MTCDEILVAVQSTCASETPDGSLMSAVKVTLQVVLEPTLAGLTVRLVMLGPAVSGVAVGVGGIGVVVGGAGVGVSVAGVTGVSGGRQRFWKGS